MAVSRIWFPASPSDGVSASDRVLLGIGYGGIEIGEPTADLGVPFRTKESLPTRPTALDGFWAEDGADGFYDEYPAQGFYGGGGYLDERKPFRRASGTKEPVPGRGEVTEGAYTEVESYGASTEPELLGALTSTNAYVLEAKPS